MGDWKSSRGWSGRAPSRAATPDLASKLLIVVDAALAGLIFVAPLFLGGRHDVGRFVFAALVGTAGIAWFTRQALLNRRSQLPWPVLAIFLGGAVMLVLQLAPLPASWLASLTPRTAETLPLWMGGAVPGTLGTWHSASMDAEATRLSLAMFAAYALLFATVYGRVESQSDAVRLIKWIGLSAGLMAAIGFVQFAVPNGKFLWIYDHPTRDAGARLGGAFANRNHFAHFVALGAPALAAWLMTALQPAGRGKGQKRIPGAIPLPPAPPLKREGSREVLVIAGLLVLACAAVLLSCSRGGALALATAGGGIGVFLFRAGLLRGRQLGLLAIGGVAVFLAISFTGYEQVMDRLGSLAAESLDDVDAGGGRRRIWEANVAAIRAGGWLGSGAGTHAEVYPLYAPDPPGKHYTHAESGYLQIVTENGVPGALLLAAALALVAVACWQALRRAAFTDNFVYAGACAAALAASAVHSACDFVWYIPACLGTTLVLAACVLRMATRDWSLKRPVRTADAAPTPVRTALPWAAGAALTAGFAGLQLLAPALAAGSWDAYLRMADAHRDFEARLLSATPEETQARLVETQNAEIAALESMIAELEATTARRPAFAAAHAMLANRLVQLFNVRQSMSDNRLPLSQVRDAAVQSKFESAAALREWLTRALDGNHELLYRAWSHARQAAALAPLEGDAYVRLAELCFLEGRGFAEADAYLQQATIVRPHDGGLLFEVGRQWGARGIGEWIEACWIRASRLPGPHRLHIARGVAGRMPVAEIITRFAPEWDVLPEYWSAFRAAAPDEANALVVYAGEQAEREVAGARAAKAAYIWRSLAQMQREAIQPDAAIASFERACAAQPDDYQSHKLLALTLCDINRWAEAQVQLAWCRDRRTDDPAVEAAALRIARAVDASPETTLH